MVIFYNNIVIDKLAGVARQGPWFNRLRRLHPSGSCVSSSENLMNFKHFHHSCTQNCDHHIFLIITGNARKRILPQIIVNTCDRELIVHNQN